MIQPKYVLNTADNTSSLDVFNEGLLITTYFFNGTDVVLGERPNEDIFDLDQMLENVGSLKEWINLVSRYLTVSLGSSSEFIEEMKKTATQITDEYKYTDEEITITDAVFVNATKLSTFQSRPETTMSFIDFNNWYNNINRFYQRSINF